jgi:hypothetical protein
MPLRTGHLGGHAQYVRLCPGHVPDRDNRGSSGPLARMFSPCKTTIKPVLHENNSVRFPLVSARKKSAGEIRTSSGFYDINLYFSLISPRLPDGLINDLAKSPITVVLKCVPKRAKLSRTFFYTSFNDGNRFSPAY